jgi:hypothetical protein
MGPLAVPDIAVDAFLRHARGAPCVDEAVANIVGSMRGTRAEYVDAIIGTGTGIEIRRFVLMWIGVRHDKARLYRALVAAAPNVTLDALADHVHGLYIVYEQAARLNPYAVTRKLACGRDTFGEYTVPALVARVFELLRDACTAIGG